MTAIPAYTTRTGRWPRRCQRTRYTTRNRRHKSLSEVVSEAMSEQARVMKLVPRWEEDWKSSLHCPLLLQPGASLGAPSMQQELLQVPAWLRSDGESKAQGWSSSEYTLLSGSTPLPCEAECE